MSKKNQHVVPHPNGWAVRPAGGERASSVHGTQKEAIDRAREIANNQGSELLVHGRNGRIRERDSGAETFEMTPLYNQSGCVSGWLNDRNGRIVDLTGRHVAFLDGDSVYDYLGSDIA